ncbi:MAG: hypothetical protein K5839_07335 [Treponemataceae bacterium]|nr:hypothetical protein [Treponemataceae bacterium]
MANGMEDLEEKNKDRPDFKKTKYKAWSNFQGREDAEMLMEKSNGWHASNSDRGDYDSYDD